MLKKSSALILSMVIILLLFVGCTVGGGKGDDISSGIDESSQLVDNESKSNDLTTSETASQIVSDVDGSDNDTDSNSSSYSSIPNNSTNSVTSSSASSSNSNSNSNSSKVNSSSSSSSSSSSTSSSNISSTQSSSQSSTVTEKVLNVPKLPEKSVTANKTEVITYNGSIDSVNDEDEYTYTAKETGRVRFEINELKSGIVLSLYIYDRLDNVVDDIWYCTNNQGVTFKVEKGQTYKIVISCNNQTEKFGTYELNIWQPKAEINVNNYSTVKDSIEFVDQRNIYKFTAPIDGTYKFYMTEMKSKAYVGMYVYNHLEELIYESDYVYNNGNGIVAKLKAGETYEIQVRYSSQSDYLLTSYTLNIGKQKETKDISGYNKVNDCIQYHQQINYYQFTVPSNGTYIFKMTEMKSDLKYYFGIYNYLDECVSKDSYCLNNDEIVLKNVKKGEIYTIRIDNADSSSSVGTYTLVIKKQ